VLEDDKIDVCRCKLPTACNHFPGGFDNIILRGNGGQGTFLSDILPSNKLIVKFRVADFVRKGYKWGNATYSVVTPW
jgi:hypothetical protein